MEKIRVSLRKIVENINLPTVLKTAILPGESIEKLFIATQVGEIYYIENKEKKTFLDISPQVIELGSKGGYDERGLLGLAFHPKFTNNGLFYLHYSVAGTQGPSALSKSFKPNPCDHETLNLKWNNRQVKFDHIDTVEEWIYKPNDKPQKRRTLLNLRRPFFNHNGVNSLNFSPETGNLVLTNGDGGAGYDPFNLSQDDLEFAGKIIEINVDMDVFDDPPVVTRFDELPSPIQNTLTVIAKGVRNIPGISYQKYYDKYIKVVGNVGQDLVESIYSFIHYKPVPASRITKDSNLTQEGFINLGWRGWEGAFPTSIIIGCTKGSTDEKTIAYYDEAIKTSIESIKPLTCYYHKEPRDDKFSGTALTGVQSYMGNEIPNLANSIVFTDFVKSKEEKSRGVLAYTKIKMDCKLNEYSIIETDYDFKSKSAYYVSLGTNLNQTKLYLGVYGSMKVTDLNEGSVFEITV